jgi:hypothetical protein
LKAQVSERSAEYSSSTGELEVAARRRRMSSVTALHRVPVVLERWPWELANTALQLDPLRMRSACVHVLARIECQHRKTGRECALDFVHCSEVVCICAESRRPAGLERTPHGRIEHVLE